MGITKISSSLLYAKFPNPTIIHFNIRALLLFFIILSTVLFKLLADNIVIGKLQFRWKDSVDKFTSDVQNIKILEASDVYYTAKTYDSNTIVGVDNSMQYLLANQDGKWQEIIGTKLKGLKRGTYEFRAKAHDNFLASNIHKVNIN
ncbi:hypothetical protein [Mycoplasma putrefaciens]|uniref:Uncharacterized protein n=1 Tax=Mycoplasma putrefaciens Mput9231 TaxID=1292033 RepID=M9WGK8_9MOLU|nr:hypothetical protein [Mycoplasma putrefaciens]AGJ90524.1 Hypothetical protein, predicted transmembrane protein [Mycoplasma putrefaciens Mput9231]